MRRNDSKSHVISSVLVIWLIQILRFIQLNQILMANGEPVDMDGGFATSVTTWSFDEPLNYFTDNIMIRSLIQ